MNWQNIFVSDRKVAEPMKLYATYTFRPENCVHQRILINIWEDANGKYTALTDHSIQHPAQADPCRDMDIYDTPDQALNGAIFGITQYVMEPYDQIKFKKEEDF